MSDKIIVPTLGESVTEATVSKWLKNQGEAVSADEPVVELETDKVNVEVPAPSNGVLENISVKDAIKVLTKKGLGVIIIKKNNTTKGILTDGDLKRLNRKFENFHTLKIKNVMKKDPFSIDKDTLAAQALSIMNAKKITSLCVHSRKQKNKTIGIIHIHKILEANIS